MATPTTSKDLIECVTKSGVVDAQRLEDHLKALEAVAGLPETPRGLAELLIRDGLLTVFQAEQCLQGKWKNFIIKGKYKILERLGQGGMGAVFLCEHTTMRHAIALKFLPPEHADDPSMLERFRREARAAAQLKHPNIAQTFDIDQAGKVHFLVMEYVFGRSLHELVRNQGHLDPERAAHYIRQAAEGLQHAHERGLVHRDIKPGNLLVDSQGTVKILDLGLARFFHDQKDNLTQQYDNNAVLGTAEYLAPEQAVDSHNVDIRSDIYSLGITFYFLLAGASPFKEGTTAQKLIWHQVAQPKPIRELRPEVPEGMAAVLNRMVAKDPGQRYQVPAEVAQALLPWTEGAIDPPSETELPRLSVAARSVCQGEGSTKLPRPDSVSTAPTRVSQGRDSAKANATPRPVPPPRTSIQPEVARNGAADQTARVSSLAADEEPDGAAPAANASRRRLLLFGGVAAGGLAAVAVALVFLWPLLFPPPGHTVARPGPGTVPPVPPPAPPPPPPPADNVAIRFEGGSFHVKAPAYEAVVEADGCLTSLRLGGKEWLRSGGPISRGCYFFQDKGVGTLKLPDVKQPERNVLVARSDKASIRYEFGPDSLRWHLANEIETPLNYFVVFKKSAVTAAQNEKDDWAATPTVKPWTAVTWYGGGSKLAMTGSDNIWGPFSEPGQEPAQVWAVAVKPHQSRDVILRVGTASAPEAARVAEVTARPPPVPIPPAPVVPSPLPPDPAVSVTKDQQTYRVQTPKYEATVEADGCLTSLRLGDVEFLKSGVSISRGAYFCRQGGTTLKLPDVTRPAANVIMAKGPEASERFEFGADLLVLKVTNPTAQAMNYFLVFDPAVTTVKNDKGQEAQTPTSQAWQTTSWTAGPARLTIYGGSRIWGPWEGQYQVWDATLAPNETRQLILKVEAAPTPPDLKVRSPASWQVFQRRTALEGQIALRGQVRSTCDRVEARLTGQSLQGPLPDKWHPVELKPGRTFDATLPTPAGGWYQLEMRALQGAKVVAQATVDHVGVGEVFVLAGQSNATNCGAEKLRPKSGLVSTFSGSGWRPADDPQPGVHDGTASGSPWPAFGDALVGKYKVPVGIASTGHAGTSVRQWQPGDELFKWMTTRMDQLGPHGFRGVLWHQGESDIGTPADEYVKLMTALIQGSRKTAGWEVPWFVAQVSYQNPYNKKVDSVRNAQKKLWETGVALEGPDTDALMGDNRDGDKNQGIHFSAKGLHAHGVMWADKVGTYLDKVLPKN